MDAQLIRYLDGELSEAEAANFLERIDREPELRKALEAEERLLEAARAMLEPTPSAGFTDRVMDSVLETHNSRDAASTPTRSAAPARPTASATSAGHHTARSARRPWPFVISAAAMILLAFALGRNSVSPSNPGQDELASAGTDQAAATTLAGHPVLRPDFTSVDPGAGQGLRIVQLVYVPEGDAPTQVAVAGSFSGWQTGKIPMQKQEGAWTATLILPPGSYEYMFLEDDTRWVTDPRAPLTRDDGFGGRNAVLDVDA